MKKIFLVSTEVGRVKGRISFYIAEILPDKGLRLIDNDFVCSSRSFRGIDTETVQCLVNLGELPAEAIIGNYRNDEYRDYVLIIVEGRGLNYINQIN
jgi:hypothetical protein